MAGNLIHFGLKPDGRVFSSSSGELGAAWLVGTLHRLDQDSGTNAERVSLLDRERFGKDGVWWSHLHCIFLCHQGGPVLIKIHFKRVGAWAVWCVRVSGYPWAAVRERARAQAGSSCWRRVCEVSVLNTQCLMPRHAPCQTSMWGEYTLEQPSAIWLSL